MSRLLLCMCAAALLAAPAAGHHQTPGKSHAVATVTIAEPVKAGGRPLAPGTYEVWILDQHPELNAGAPSNAQRVVELHQGGKVVATDVAEVFASERSGGTAGSAGMAKAVVQKLRGGEFLRIAINDAGARYLIHLPTEAFSEPAPQPQAPSRVVLPPAETGTPSTPRPQ